MRASSFFITTHRENPADAEIISHQLMVRSGMIRRQAAGIYTYLPLGVRILRKIETIVREEMNRAGAIELLMPLVQPAELWQETERWHKYGPELLRIKDRHARDFVLQPTSEEMITDLARNELRSHKSLPINFYHIQTKFRDERRPRFGLMRGREFLMKDAYSFDKDLAGLQLSYQKMYDAYVQIFTRLGLRFRAVAADNGAIGGSGSHEFHVLAKTGEDALAVCLTSEYAANLEAAEALPALSERLPPTEPLKKVATPPQISSQALADYLKIPLTKIVQPIVIQPGPQAPLVVLLLRADHSLNEVKVRKIPGLENYSLASDTTIFAACGTPASNLGVCNMHKPLQVIADRTVAMMHDFVCGANEAGMHCTGINWERDHPMPQVADLRNVVEGDLSPDGKGQLSLERGIEVGHVFQLGTTYSQAMQAAYLDASGQNQYLYMGCYGIGISRILAAAIEQNFDEKGIIWPSALAPFSIVLCPMDQSPAVQNATANLYKTLQAQAIDVLWDDRGERPGVMFSDWELIGIPHRIVIGSRSLSQEAVEYQGRTETSPTMVPVAQMMDFLKKKLHIY